MILQQRQGKQVKCLIQSIQVVINCALTHTHPHPPTPSQQKGHTHLGHPAVNQQQRKFVIIHWLTKFIRNSGSPKYNFSKVRCQTIYISVQYRINGKSAAVINNFRHILTYHLSTIFHAFASLLLTTYCFFSYHVYYFALFSLSRVLLCKLCLICLMILYKRRST